jgi:hypothetical protein
MASVDVTEKSRIYHRLAELKPSFPAIPRSICQFCQSVRPAHISHYVRYRADMRVTFSYIKVPLGWLLGQQGQPESIRTHTPGRAKWLRVVESFNS